MTADENDHQDRNERDGKNGRESDGESFCPGEWAKHAAFLRFEEKYGQERDEDDQQRKEDCRADLLCAAQENVSPLLIRKDDT